MSDVRDLARELVAIPSHEDETAAGDAVEAWLREHTDAAVTRDEAGNVFARRGSGTPLALVGHHDVVPPADEQTEGDGYTLAEHDGRLYGRGTADMKGSLAAMLCAFRDADLAPDSGSGSDSGPGPDSDSDVDPTPDSGSDADCELVVASFVGEEDGGVGARAAIDAGFAPDYAVVGEGSTGYSAPGVTDVAVAHKGRRGSTVVARGTAAHASEPEAGENAVYRACDAVETIRELSAPEADVFGQRLRGSVVVTGIEGGEAWNAIPERCEVTVDERTVPGERAPLDRVESVPGVEWTVDQDLPPMRCDDAAFADLLLRAARDAQDGDPQRIAKPHATDAGWLAEAGTTCLVCGAAEPGEAHTAEESVSLSVLERCYRIYRAAAERFAGRD